MIGIYDNIFHISDGKYSYAFYIKDGKLIHSYYGKALSIDKTHADKSVIAAFDGFCAGTDWALFETAEQGRGDYRIPSVVVRGDRFASTDFKYVSHEVLKDKPSLGLPALRGKAETLKIVMRDDVAELELRLYYSVYDGALARHAEIVNCGKKTVTLCTADSACVEFERDDYSYISLDGRWGQEGVLTRREVSAGIHTISSTRGISSHQHNPFLAVLRGGADEEHGEVYGFNLIYSGNFAIRFESDEKAQLRVNLGVNLLEGGIELAPGESFITPEAVCVYSDSGIGGMSRLFHKLYRKHLVNPKFADKPRPVVVNSWESVYFDFDEKKLREFIVGAKGLGIDTVVLDDGWFGHRDCDNSSLGDWVIDKRKLPNGLTAVIDCCKQNGMKFGLWFEPECVSPDSDLYRAHPEYAIGTAGRTGVEMRNQYVLDFSNKDVVNYIYESMYKILSEHDISYVKWDMNRPLSDVDDTKKYLGCVKGVYELYERITAAFPNLLIEGCCSGGGRFDPAILYYSPMIWSSDDSDAIERTRIQYGLSMCYPLQTLSNHVSTCPNHQVSRITPFETRCAVASLGCMGYELNVAKISDGERELIKKQTERYKRCSKLILTGELYRISNPFTDNAFCEEIVAEDGSEAYAVFVRHLNICNLPLKKIRLKGLIPTAMYNIEERNIKLTGAELMYCGIQPIADGDFGSEALHIVKCN